MFGKITVFFSLLLLGASVKAFFHFAALDVADLLKYQELVKESVELRSKTALQREPAKQFRTEVQKDIWTLNNHQRLHYRLKSSESGLTIWQTKGKIEAVELLKNIECCMQEEIEQDQQQIRYLFTSDGTYFFPGHRFAAEEIDLFFFSLPGNELPTAWPETSPFLRGTANEVIFSASGGLPSFTADYLNAEVDTNQ